MSFFSRLPGDAGVRHAMALNKPAGRALVELHTRIMRQPSDLSAGERELIAAYVSALNNCRYCHGVHSVTAEAFGVDAGLLTRMTEVLVRSGLEHNWLHMMAYVRKLAVAKPSCRRRCASGICRRLGRASAARRDRCCVSLQLHESLR
jgi:AhpD family alkylhydroperoxidase